MICRDFHTHPEWFILDVEAKLGERAYMRLADGTLEVRIYIFLTQSLFHTRVAVYRKCKSLLFKNNFTKCRGKGERLFKW